MLPDVVEVLPDSLSEVVLLPVDVLRLDVSPRVDGPDREHVRMLADAGRLPPIIVHRPTMRVVDGVHRVHAAVLRGAGEVQARYVGGAERDAFVLAVRANTGHGLPLTRADREAAVGRIIATHPEWSDRSIALRTGLSARTVSRARARSTAAVPHSNARVGQDGRLRPIDAVAGRLRVQEVISASPDASVREVARLAGVSLGTAHDVRGRVRRGESPVPDGRRCPQPAAARQDGVRAGPAPAPVGSGRDAETLLRMLARDPALRFREEGRQLLRRLHQGTVWPAQRDTVVGVIPAHCAAAVAELARSCARAWSELADEMDRRGC